MHRVVLGTSPPTTFHLLLDATGHRVDMGGACLGAVGWLGEMGKGFIGHLVQSAFVWEGDGLLDFGLERSFEAYPTRLLLPPGPVVTSVQAEYFSGISGFALVPVVEVARLAPPGAGVFRAQLVRAARHGEGGLPYDLIVELVLDAGQRMVPGAITFGWEGNTLAPLERRTFVFGPGDTCDFGTAAGAAAGWKDTRYRRLNFAPGPVTLGAVAYWDNAGDVSPFEVRRVVQVG